MHTHFIVLCLLLSGWLQAADAPVVRLTTDLGMIEAELDADQAPATVANFLKYVDAGRYTGGVFHRTVKLRPDNQLNCPVKIEVIHGRS